ncbi:MAG: hypothetical protein AB1571_04230, partial [Nanoarchaeota archaeon]
DSEKVLNKIGFFGNAEFYWYKACCWGSTGNEVSIVGKGGETEDVVCERGKEKRGQLEMFGLVIIVVLIAVIGLFAIKFVFLRGEEGFTAETKLGIEASNIVNAVLKANICENKDGRSIIIGCCENVDNCNRNSCDIIKSEIKGILGSIEQENKEYRLKIGNCFEVKSGKFNECKTIVNSNYPIKGANRLYNLELALCKL